MPNLDEKIFFFEGSHKRSLLGFLHIPVAHRKKTGVVYCHPFADEQSLSHRVAVETSRKIAEIGFPVLRFDFSGCGDSQGELIEARLSDWLEDLRAAINYIKATLKIEDIILWGLRLGASIALLHAIKHHEIKSLILWQPVTNFENHFNQFIKREIFSTLTENPNRNVSIDTTFDKLQKKGEVNIIGYPISNDFLASFRTINKTAFIFKKPVCNGVVISVSLMQAPSSVLKNFNNQLLSNGMNAELKHVIADPFWDRYWRWSCPEITAATIHWITNSDE
jgi:uncharacterized protein